jgi:hypothetical protein
MQTGRRAVSAEGEEQRQQSDKRRRLAQLAGTMRSVGEAGGGEAEGRKRERKKTRARRDKTRDERRERRDKAGLGWDGDLGLGHKVLCLGVGFLPARSFRVHPW